MKTAKTAFEIVQGALLALIISTLAVLIVMGVVKSLAAVLLWLY